jgi:aspartokinase/homoserine dehydrogenase 1
MIFGTLISHTNVENNEDVAVGISNLSKVALLTLEGSGMIGIPGVSTKLFQCLSQEKINVILITQKFFRAFYHSCHQRK